MNEQIKENDILNILEDLVFEFRKAGIKIDEDKLHKHTECVSNLFEKLEDFLYGNPMNFSPQMFQNDWKKMLRKDLEEKYWTLENDQRMKDIIWNFFEKDVNKMYDEISKKYENVLKEIQQEISPSSKK